MSCHQEISAHQCIRRDDDGAIWNKVCAWWLLPVHSLAVIILTSLMLYVVNGPSFLLDSSSSFDHPRIMLYQSDITALVSLALVILRLLAAAWFSLTAWRKMFIILEKRGMKW